MRTEFVRYSGKREGMGFNRKHWPLWLPITVFGVYIALMVMWPLLACLP